MELRDIIIEKIRDTGPISFHDFMEMALYYPGLGYYTSGKERIGKQGDYYTSPVLNSLYAQMLGKQIEEMWCLMEKQPFSIVEYGAGTCALCCDILNYLQNNEPLYASLKYYIIEKNGLKQQEKYLPEDKVIAINSIEEISGINGCILTNEVVDNFPVHLVVMENELLEIFIDFENEFMEVLKPAPTGLNNYLDEQEITLPPNYRTEINLQAREWIETIAVNLNKGFVITVDYGFPAAELYAAKRTAGTLACYHNHSVTDMPYCNIGQQDITAHVNFSALKLWGAKFGLDYIGYCNQSYFLRSLGLANYLREIEKTQPNYHNNSSRAIHMLLLEMGNNFKVLIQQKGIKARALTGMQFCGVLN